MRSFLNQLSLDARLRLIAITSITLVLAFLGVMKLLDRLSYATEMEARSATEALISASSLEKDLTSLMRDTYLMAGAATPDRIDAALGNLSDFETALRDTESKVSAPAYTRALSAVRADLPALERLITERLLAKSPAMTTPPSRTSSTSWRSLTMAWTLRSKWCATAPAPIWKRPGPSSTLWGKPRSRSISWR
jgi:hypothetical protein